MKKWYDDYWYDDHFNIDDHQFLEEINNIFSIKYHIKKFWNKIKPKPKNIKFTMTIEQIENEIETKSTGSKSIGTK